MKIENCKLYSVVPFGVAEALQTDERMCFAECKGQRVDTYTENKHPGLVGHLLTYIGYMKVNDPLNMLNGEDNLSKIHIFVDNYWYAIGSGNE